MQNNKGFLITFGMNNTSGSSSGSWSEKYIIQAANESNAIKMAADALEEKYAASLFGGTRVMSTQSEEMENVVRLNDI